MTAIRSARGDAGTPRTGQIVPGASGVGYIGRTAYQCGLSHCLTGSRSTRPRVDTNGQHGQPTAGLRVGAHRRGGQHRLPPVRLHSDGHCCPSVHSLVATAGRGTGGICAVGNPRRAAQRGQPVQPGLPLRQVHRLWPADVARCWHHLQVREQVSRFRELASKLRPVRRAARWAGSVGAERPVRLDVPRPSRTSRTAAELAARRPKSVGCPAPHARRGRVRQVG